MRKLTFIHVSDLHFGQEKDETAVINKDILERLIEDATQFLAERELTATGAIATGDIAFSGAEDEYKRAGVWFDRLAREADFDRTSVVVVPGNHDVERKQVGASGQFLVDQIILLGDGKLEAFLQSEVDRSALYSKLEQYSLFAGGYGCVLSDAGGAAEKVFYFDDECRHGIRFVGLNSALACGKGDAAKGSLLLGARQRVIAPADRNIQNVVLVHHPIDWCSDSADATLFLHARCRILICGHEHRSNASIERLDDGRDFLTIRAGAAAPPKNEGPVPFTYNIIEIEADPAGLAVMIHPRDWDDSRKRFEESRRPMLDDRAFERTVLSCIASREATATVVIPAAPIAPAAAGHAELPVSGDDVATEQPSKDVATRLAHARIEFFRHLTLPLRLQVLHELGGLPKSISEVRLTVTLESKALDKIAADGKIALLEEAVKRLVFGG